MKVFKSDKSESSIADQMDVTPSDYNPQNMRFVSDKNADVGNKRRATVGGSNGLVDKDDKEPEKMVPTITMDSEASQDPDLDSLFNLGDGLGKKDKKNNRRTRND